MVSVDGRIPVVVGRAEMARMGDRVVIPEPAARPGHVPGCACCAPRDTLARMLGALFLEHARAALPPFSRVLVVADDAEPVRRAIEADVIARARYRFGGRA